MRTIPAALATHIQGEVISLAKCLKITKADGSVVRLTTHDRDLTVGGDVYRADISLETSAIQMTDDLSVDNMEVTIGLDEVVVKKSHFNTDLYKSAPFELFLVNWQSIADGVIYLKRGWVGDITIQDDTKVLLQLRGLTQALQRNIVEKYSPTCRTALGGAKCGVPNIPLRIRRPRQRVKSYDWFLIPNTNVTDYSLSNSSFESDGAVSNGTSGITGWTHAAGSYWKVQGGFTAGAGTYYLEGGDDGLGASTGTEFTLYRTVTTADLGMVNADIDDGDYTLDMSVLVAATSNSVANPGRCFIEFLDVDGNTLQRKEADYIEPEYQSWQGIGATAFVNPGTRSVKIGLQCRKDEGADATVAFDDVTLRFWTNELASYGGAAFKVARIPAGGTGMPVTERLTLDNPNFTANGAVANSTSGITGWTYGTGDYWQVVASAGAISPRIGGYMLRGGTGGTGDQTLSVTEAVSAAAAEITAGYYIAQIEVYAAKVDSSSLPRVTIECLNASNTVLATYDTGYTNIGAIETWVKVTASVKAPSGTTQVRGTLYADATNPNVVYDEVVMTFFATAVNGANDPGYTLLGPGLTPTVSYTVGDYTYDNGALLQAENRVFAFASVTGTGDQRTFNASAISDTAARLYSGKIVWLSGANAGRTSFIRIWNNTTKQIKLYSELAETIAVGDKFVFALGCDKTIDTCADTFRNAHNFRGEPYLPGPNKVIEFLVRDDTAV